MSIGKRTFQSAGQISQHLIPGAYSRIDSVVSSTGLVSANNGVIMGQCLGGEPFKLLEFSNISEAVNTLKGGALMEAMRLAFNPGSGYTPQKLYAMRVNAASKSTLSWLSTAAPMITLTSKDWGLSNNQIKATLATSTDTYGKKVTIVYKTFTEIFDNIKQNSFTIEYATGVCTMTIVNTSAAHTLVTSAGGISIDLTAYPTINDVVSYINSVAAFTASVTAGQEEASSLELDGVTAHSIYGSSYTAQSTMYAIIDTINAGSSYVDAVAANATVTITIPDNKVATYFTGGAEGSYTSTQWGLALTALEAEDVQFISTPDTSAAVHAVIKTHCASMNAVTGRKERQGLVGGAWGDTVATATAAAIVLNQEDMLYVYNGFTQRDVNGTVQNYAASYGACLLLGMTCGMAINMPLTSKQINIIAIEKKLTTTELETLIYNGVCPLNYNSKGLPTIIRQVTSYQSDNLIKNEFSMVKEKFFVSRDLRSNLEDLFVGQPGNASILGRIKNAVYTRLNTYVNMGIFTADSTGVSYWNIILTINGDTVTIDYDAYLTAPVNFIFITNHFHTIVTV